MQIQMTSVKWFGIWFRFARVVDNGSDGEEEERVIECFAVLLFCSATKLHVQKIQMSPPYRGWKTLLREHM
jgi:hypothetical protein